MFRHFPGWSFSWESKQASRQEKVKRMMNVRVPTGGFEGHGDISWEAHAAAVAHMCGLEAYIRKQEVRIGREKEDGALQVGLIVWTLHVKAKGWREKLLCFPHILLFHLLQISILDSHYNSDSNT